VIAMSRGWHSVRPTMRPIIVTPFVTLDGVMQAAGRETSHPPTGWVMGA